MRLALGHGLTDVVRALDGAGIEVDDIVLKAPTLDDVFLAKTGRTLEGDGSEEGEDGGVSVLAVRSARSPSARSRGRCASRPACSRR